MPNSEQSKVYPMSLSAVPRFWVRWIAVALAALAWWLSLDLYRLSFDNGTVSPLLAAFCDTGADSPCQTALASQWGSIRLSRTGDARLPVSLVGMAYFAFVGFWYLLVGCPTYSRRPWHVVIVAVVALGLLTSVQYTLLMRQMGAWCPGCLIVHTLNAVLALLTFAAFPWRAETLPHQPHPRGRLVMATFMGGGFLFLLHIALGFLLIQSSNTQRMMNAYLDVTRDVAYIAWNHQRSEPRAIARRETPRWFGEPDAAHTLVAFLDFGCPRCREANESIEQALAAHPGRLRVDFRQFPLDQQCNPDLPRSLHTGACEAARQAEAAFTLGGPDAFLASKSRLYEAGGPLDESAARAWVADMGWEWSDWEAAVESAAEAVAADIAVGSALEVTSVPALFLDGRRLGGWPNDNSGSEADLEVWGELLRPGD